MSDPYAHDDFDTYDVPGLPAAGEVQDEAGEGTMDEVPAGLLGSRATRKRHLADTAGDADAVEAELVSAQDDIDADTVDMDPNELDTIDMAPEELDPETTVNIGDETLAEMSRGTTRRLGDFELERKVGQGGMGEVWLARQISLDRPVAVKVLPRTLATQENFIERFQREAKAAASLVHPNVIQIYAYGIDEGTPYFAMEFVEGEDLAERARRERLEWSEIVDVMIGVASALHVAHDKGLIHRDIKPSNVMVDKNGIVKVMDFGLAKATSGGPEAKNLTNAGLIMGTPNYLSPEQGRGDPLDGRSDLYSLGIVLYELLTGSLPFRADTPAGLIFKHVYEPPPQPASIRSDIPPFLEEITLKLLEKDPDERYANPQELLADLGEFLDHYDYYVAEGGERRPGSGFYDPERLRASTPGGNISGAHATRKRNISERRNAVTEEMSGGVSKPAPVEAAEPEVEPETAPEGPKKRTSARRRPPAPPPRKSRAPLALFLLLLAAGAAFGYAYHSDPERVRSIMRDQLGLLPVDTDGTDPGVTTPSPRDGADPPPPQDLPAEVLDGYVAFVFTGSWPTATTIRLRGAKNTHELERQTTGKFPPGEYRLEFDRPGYQSIAWTVRLTGEPGREGRLVDAKGVDAAAVPLQWEPTDELRRAYAAGREALAAGDLTAAKEALDLAGRLDPAFRPGDDAPAVSELVARLAAQLDQRRRVDDQRSSVLAVCRQHTEAKRWRTAHEILLGLPDAQRDATWKDLVGLCDSGIKAGDAMVESIGAALKRGEHAAVQQKLADLALQDPEHPARSTLEERLRKASAARERALWTEDEPLQAAKARLDDYLAEYGPHDGEAQRVQAQVVARIVAAEQLERGIEEVDALASAGDWQRARRAAISLLAEHPTEERLQELRRRAERALAEADVNALVAQLDRSLVAGEVDRVVRLIDEHSGAYDKERAALRGLREVEAVFTTSDHRNLRVELEGSVARVRAEWRFDMSLLGEPVHSYEADHVLRLRRSGNSWLLTELRVEGDVRVRPR